jgi:hypothetical protein
MLVGMGSVLEKKNFVRGDEVLVLCKVCTGSSTFINPLRLLRSGGQISHLKTMNHFILDMYECISDSSQDISSGAT